MKIFEGKSPTERNKIIAALVLGAMALLVLSYTFIMPLFSNKKTIVNINNSPTPKSSVTPSGATANSTYPTQAETDFTYSTTRVYYSGATYAPEAGRNIFAFYEPPPPTPYSPTPIPTATPDNRPTPTQIPPPPITVFSVAPPNNETIYAGQQSFRLEISGDKFTPDSQVSVNNMPLLTTYYSPQRLTVEVPASMIANAATLFITVTTLTGLFSNQVSLTIQPQPKPQFQFIGAILRSGNNNNTAFIKEGTNLVTKRLNDAVGRFQIISIAKNEIVVKDTALGFTHRVEVSKASGQSTNNNRTESSNPTYNPNIPTNPTNPTNTAGCIPGIPCDLQRYNPNSNLSPIQQQQQQKQQQQQQKDYDDEDGDN